MSSETPDDKQQPTIRHREGHGFAPLPDDGGSYAVPQESSRGPLILVLAIAVLLVFGVVVWNAYKQGVRSSNRDDLPQIASEGAFKTKPITPGGRVDEHVDMEVLHQGAGQDDDEVFTSTQVREEPVPVSEGIETVASGDQQYAALQSKPPSASVKPPQKAIVGRTGEPVDLQSMLSDLETSPPPAPISEEMAPVKPEPAAKVKAPVPVQTIEKPVDSSLSAANISGDYVVQLASVRDKAAIETEWKKASARAPELFLNVQQSVQTADLGEKGVWHRIQAAAFETRESAGEFCASYKKRGGDCIVKKR